jgi:hypothetical protein
VWADRVDDRAALLIFFTQEGHDQANAEVKTFQDKEPDPQNSNQDEPNGL